MQPSLHKFIHFKIFSQKNSTTVIVFHSSTILIYYPIRSTETSLTFVPVGPVIISPSVSFKAL